MSEWDDSKNVEGYSELELADNLYVRVSRHSFNKANWEVSLWHTTGRGWTHYEIKQWELAAGVDLSRAKDLAIRIVSSFFSSLQRNLPEIKD
jgi:hypothetical protein